MSGFSFSFSGDDIEESSNAEHELPSPKHAAETGTLRPPSGSAFPISGQPLLQPQRHDLNEMITALPSKISYSTLVVKLDDGTEMFIPRRELWDVRVQLMAEEDDEGLGNLGKDDVKTGVYEGGFKSWESSLDVVKVLHQKKSLSTSSRSVLELGCGTALPSLAVLQWLLEDNITTGGERINLSLADYNSTVLQLVTLPNLLLSWAQSTRRELWEPEGELEIDQELTQQFLSSLHHHQIALSFFSGDWGAEFVQLVSSTICTPSRNLTIIGAETIYSPVALKSFAETLMSLLKISTAEIKTALVAAKKVYFGVGGSMEDFCDLVRANRGTVNQLREESDGVRRAVVEVEMEPPSI